MHSAVLNEYIVHLIVVFTVIIRSCNLITYVYAAVLLTVCHYYTLLVVYIFIYT